MEEYFNPVMKPNDFLKGGGNFCYFVPARNIALNVSDNACGL